MQRKAKIAFFTELKPCTRYSTYLRINDVAMQKKPLNYALVGKLGLKGLVKVFWDAKGSKKKLATLTSSLQEIQIRRINSCLGSRIIFTVIYSPSTYHH